MKTPILMLVALSLVWGKPLAAAQFCVADGSALQPH